ncbi:phosphate regulon transcriptional regulator PhoB [Nitrosococcus oceani]|uniref:Phosphate regulon transcriptional regulatory protein PhoB n=2 Tax=Nitrosococcus oceani TaxID=1229 RepID=Q3J8I7_NITOC|nr:phosphate regulon transcriptional regulator PhoB [Nitrosococcus oceani]KFI18660.1 chemotaxis protein CheY [Nitrosococcus oceani C-27]ABA58859.1 two component transcriptional regulator, winged helix family [Nitrosococcus oceani ATCC 19707]EDZ68137.1 phosphate regulon transcriptional regulatory protein PhoB [Nitrosococcus oceani AFC27]KFI21921.1 chemotaxis protein CheY [Nitrosococcus oceani]GEM19050.1 DNA-binding response regulator [Nitrosococcus oceani]
MVATILVVDDEAAIREMLGFALTQEGYYYQAAADGEQAWQRINESHPDLILLDWMLPGISGVDLARRLKREPSTRELPVIMLTARDEEEDKVRGLNVGADDYITKPFSPTELIARIKAVLRRSAPLASGEVIEFDGLKLDPGSHRLSVRGTPLEMGPTEFRLLHFFLTHLERVYSRGQLIDYVWGDNVYVEERTVDVHIRRLRKSLEPSGHDGFIQTVRGVGYRFSNRS